MPSSPSGNAVRPYPNTTPQGRRRHNISATRGGCLRRYLLLTVVLLGLGWLLWVFVQIEVTARRDDAVRADAIIVLGTAQYQGRPSQIFRARLDHAYTLYENGIAPVVVVAGGNQPGDTYTEASAGAQYLRELGVPQEALLPVGEGDSTFSSLEAVANELRASGLESAVLVSDPFHMYRSLRMATDLGLDAHSSPTTTSPVQDRPASHLHYTVREVVAYTAYVLGRIAPPPSTAQKVTDLGLA